MIRDIKAAAPQGGAGLLTRKGSGAIRPVTSNHQSSSLSLGDTYANIKLPKKATQEKDLFSYDIPEEIELSPIA
jgi:hypothetical protein